MIYVRRDPSLIQEKVLKVAERAQTELEALPAENRKAFIDMKSHVWRAFSRYLAKMSYGKCWYSESHDPQSFFDVDHFRPKKEAKRADNLEDGGYPWLAFSWENFRYSAGRSNRLSTDEVTQQVVGKGSWFPLMENSVKADWTDRCEDEEKPVLLDPTVRADMDLIDIDPDDGRAIASCVCIGPHKKFRTQRSIEIYGLNLGNLTTARKRAIREIEDHFRNLTDIVSNNVDMDAAERLVEQIRRATASDAQYARAARAKLHKLGGSSFCAQPEDQPLVA